ncbi:unnamed protein product, partial [Amoebophrya sp. A120]
SNRTNFEVARRTSNLALTKARKSTQRDGNMTTEVVGLNHPQSTVRDQARRERMEEIFIRSG